MPRRPLNAAVAEPRGAIRRRRWVLPTAKEILGEAARSARQKRLPWLCGHSLMLVLRATMAPWLTIGAWWVCERFLLAGKRKFTRRSRWPS